MKLPGDNGLVERPPLVDDRLEERLKSWFTHDEQGSRTIITTRAVLASVVVLIVLCVHLSLSALH